MWQHRIWTSFLCSNWSLIEWWNFFGWTKPVSLVLQIGTLLEVLDDLSPSGPVKSIYPLTFVQLKQVRPFLVTVKHFGKYVLGVTPSKVKALHQRLPLVHYILQQLTWDSHSGTCWRILRALYLTVTPDAVVLGLSGVEFPLCLSHLLFGSLNFWYLHCILSGVLLFPPFLSLCMLVIFAFNFLFFPTACLHFLYSFSLKFSVFVLQVLLKILWQTGVLWNVPGHSACATWTVSGVAAFIWY